MFTTWTVAGYTTASVLLVTGIVLFLKSRHLIRMQNWPVPNIGIKRIFEYWATMLAMLILLVSSTIGLTVSLLVFDSNFHKFRLESCVELVGSAVSDRVKQFREKRKHRDERQ